MKLISLIIPTFNESQIKDSLSRLVSYLNTLPQYQFELIVVDDSLDNTFLVVDEFFRDLPITHQLIRGMSRGKGGAVKLGAAAARGDIVFCIDADFTIPLENILVFIRLMESHHYDIVIGERFSESKLSKFKSSPVRFVLSWVLLLIQRYVIFHSHFFYDTQCGFKAFSRQSIQSAAGLQRIMGGMYDIEYLYIAKKNRLQVGTQRVYPLPEVRKSTIRVFQCMKNDPVELMKMKWAGLCGYYRIPS